MKHTVQQDGTLLIELDAEEREEIGELLAGNIDKVGTKNAWGQVIMTADGVDVATFSEFVHGNTHSPYNNSDWDGIDPEVADCGDHVIVISEYVETDDHGEVVGHGRCWAWLNEERLSAALAGEGKAALAFVKGER